MSEAERQRYEFPPVAVSVDVVIFTIRADALKLLLIRRGIEPHKDKWALPGGFIHAEESLEAAAERELAEETGVVGVFLEQLYTFGDAGRDPRGRVISVAYYALVPSDSIILKASSDAAEAAWFPFAELPELAFDHRLICDKAHERLVAKLDYSTIAFQFMPAEFTLGELQQVYETILGQDIDKRNFRKWVLALERVVETGNTSRGGKHRPARLYRLTDPGKVDIIK